MRKYIQRAAKTIRALRPGAARERFYSLCFQVLSALCFVAFHGTDEEKREALFLYRRFKTDVKNGRLEIIEREANAIFQRSMKRIELKGPHQPEHG